MLTFDELYKRVMEASTSKKPDSVLEALGYDPYHLDCVFNPESKPERWKTFNHFCRESGKTFADCFFNHLKQDETGKLVPNLPKEKCEECLGADNMNKLLASKDVMAVLSAIRQGDRPVYACIAPAFLSQFDLVTDAQLRSAFKQLGFQGMVEVSLFADILTLKEALEFDRMIVHENDYMLTSCCCPTWISMIRKAHPELLVHVPKSVSPMVATGRTIKSLVPNAMTVFVGPCLAKKVEAKEEDIKDAIDVVLTFREVKDIMETAKINPDFLKKDVREHSSAAGRIYAVNKGVSEAVQMTLKRLRPDKAIQVKAIQADGVLECRKLIEDLEKGQINANFLEGMGCKGGCVGGPRALIDREIAKQKVIEYAKKSPYETPLDNPYVIEMLARLGIHSVEELLEDQKIFTRHF